MPSEALTHEYEAINSIYGPSTFQAFSASSDSDSDSDIYTLSLPEHDVTLRISFPAAYPAVAPRILGTENTGGRGKKGDGKRVLEVARRVLGEVFREGEVCVFDLVLGVVEGLGDEGGEGLGEEGGEGERPVEVGEEIQGNGMEQFSGFGVPSWTVSEPVTEKKSVFLAHACAVTSPGQAQAYISHLLAVDKRAAKATHNISAYRVRSRCPDGNPGTELIFQDCDDDGENAAGGRLLHLLQIMDVWGLLVVVSRWYGGVQLGPDRFRIINAVARDAVVAGGWVKGGGVDVKGSAR